jgi:hypothetical protein
MRTSILRLLPVGFLVLAACSTSPPSPAPTRGEPQASEPSERDLVRARLAVHRVQQIERLGDYASRGEFPHNYAKAPSAHIFRDDAGRLCAVANLVHQDGRDDLVDATVRTRNDLAVADVHDGPMLDWVLGSGLTQEEVARIQLPAPVMAPPVAKPVKKAPLLVAQADAEETRMKEAVVRHIEQVQWELRAATEKSLDAATERYLATHVAGGV